jgi:hypothetical protein
MPDANDLSLEEWKAVVALIRDTVTTDKFSYSDRIQTLRRALAKLDLRPPKPHKERPLPLTGPVVGPAGSRAANRTLYIRRERQLAWNFEFQRH